MDYKKGYEQYKGKCERLEKENESLNEKLKAFEATNEAFIASILVAATADKDNPLKYTSGDLANALENLRVVIKADEDAFKIYYALK